MQSGVGKIAVKLIDICPPQMLGFRDLGRLFTKIISSDVYKVEAVRRSLCNVVGLGRIWQMIDQTGKDLAGPLRLAAFEIGFAKQRLNFPGIAVAGGFCSLTINGPGRTAC